MSLMLMRQHFDALSHEERPKAVAGVLCDLGLTLNDCLRAFALDDADSPFPAAAAEKYELAGVLEIEDAGVVSQSLEGAYVLAWVWVSNEDAGIDGDD